jgi:hypothetical protein
VEKTVIGHIDCPTCGIPNGMRITHDKNGEPFGYCAGNCRQQLRIGGDPYRVQQFIKKHPWAGKKPVTVTEQEPAQIPEKIPVTVTEPAKPGKKPVTEPEPIPSAPKRKATFADALNILGGGR